MSAAGEGSGNRGAHQDDSRRPAPGVHHTEQRTELIEVPRTARYLLLGAEHEPPEEVWFAVHGMSQLAASFARRFAGVASATRLVVVPEALSRYYLAPAEAVHAGQVKVGARWMTREARDLEIADHVRYLDLLWERLAARYPLDRVRVTVLGFSQGVATISRWLARSRVARADAVILWGGKVPADIFPVDADSPLRAARWTMVVGDRDDYATPEVVEEEKRKLREAGIPFDHVSFAGGHAIDPDTLLKLARR